MIERILERLNPFNSPDAESFSAPLELIDIRKGLTDKATEFMVSTVDMVFPGAKDSYKTEQLQVVAEAPKIVAAETPAQAEVIPSQPTVDVNIERVRNDLDSLYQEHAKANNTDYLARS